jgi:hypothetical protein
MSNTPNEAQSKKIIVDEDWKAQATAEKEALEQQRAANAQHESGPVSATPETDAKSAPEAKPADDDPPLPKPTLALLLQSLAVEAMMALGVVAMSENAKPRPNQARHLIDTLELLQEKTQGNRSADESAMLEDLLHQLRLGFIAVQDRSAKPS